MNDVMVKTDEYRWILISEPQADVYENEARLDRATGEPLWVLECLKQHASGGSGETVKVRLPQSGLKGLSSSAVMSTVAFEGLRAIPYTRNNRAHLALRAVKVAAA